MGTSREGFGNLGGTNGEEGGWETKNPSHPIPKRKKQAHHEGILSLPIGGRRFLFPKLSVSIVFLGFVESISPQFLHCFFLDLFVSAVYFCLTRRGHGKPATSSLPTPKVHFSNLDKQPKEITRYPGREYPKPDSFFHDGQIKDANDKRKEWNFGGPHN